MTDLVGGGPGEPDPQPEPEPVDPTPAPEGETPTPPVPDEPEQGDGPAPTAADYGEPGETQPDWITPPADEVAPERPQGDPEPNVDIERTPETTVDGQPAVQQGTQSGPAAGPSPDAGGATADA